MPTKTKLITTSSKEMSEKGDLMKLRSYSTEHELCQYMKNLNRSFVTKELIGKNEKTSSSGT